MEPMVSAEVQKQVVKELGKLYTKASGWAALVGQIEG